MSWLKEKIMRWLEIDIIEQGILTHQNVLERQQEMNEIENKFGRIVEKWMKVTDEKLITLKDLSKIQTDQILSLMEIIIRPEPRDKEVICPDCDKSNPIKLYCYNCEKDIEPKNNPQVEKEQIIFTMKKDADAKHQLEIILEHLLPDKESFGIESISLEKFQKSMKKE